MDFFFWRGKGEQNSFRGDENVCPTTRKISGWATGKNWASILPPPISSIYHGVLSLLPSEWQGKGGGQIWAQQKGGRRGLEIGSLYNTFLEYFRQYLFAESIEKNLMLPRFNRIIKIFFFRGTGSSYVNWNLPHTTYSVI